MVPLFRERPHNYIPFPETTGILIYNVEGGVFLELNLFPLWFDSIYPLSANNNFIKSPKCLRVTEDKTWWILRHCKVTKEFQGIVPSYRRAFHCVQFWEAPTMGVLLQPGVCSPESVSRDTSTKKHKCPVLSGLSAASFSEVVKKCGNYLCILTRVSTLMCFPSVFTYYSRSGRACVFLSGSFRCKFSLKMIFVVQLSRRFFPYWWMSFL